LLADAHFNERVRQALQRPVESMREVAARYGELFQAADAEFTSASKTAPPTPPAEAVARLHEFLHSPDSPTTVPDSAIVNIEYYLPTPVCEELNKLRADVDRRWLEIGQPASLILRDRPAQPNPRVFRRGSPSQPAHEVPRQFLGILSGAERHPFTQGSGRLELARAITDPANPLTARVLVNRVWQHHFGRGLVETPSDLGLRAQPPTHPELLDWLALRFIADGWSIKSLHRRIVLSAVYQTANRPAPESDPNQRLLSSFPGRRLEFEQVRDSMLAVSGQLSLARGGKSSELLDAANHRRTVYAFVDRQFLPGVLRTFDFANPDLHVAVRHETTVPQQGLFFLNGPFAAQRARELAQGSRDLPAQDRIRHLHQALFQRNPTAAELGTGLRFIQQSVEAEAQRAKPPEPSLWLHGFGEYDETTRRLKSFKPLPHFTGTAWQGAESFPGGETGWAQLTATGGHPGNTRAFACIRRWTAPSKATVSFSGTLIHEPTEGDGVRGFVLSSRHGTLASATVHHSRAELAANAIELEAGDTLDFLVDIGGGLGYDQFLWNPVVTSNSTTWEAARGFNGPVNSTHPLDPWEQYAHVLLLTNEFAFVD
jgi:hypothetical protein